MKNPILAFRIAKTLRTILLSGLILTAFAANANTLTVGYVSGPSSSGIWVYSATLTNGTLQAGDGFTIYDFNNYVLGSIFAPANWVANVQLVGGYSPPPGSGDNPSVFNLTFTWVGPTITTISPFVFSGFGAQDPPGSTILLPWSSMDHTLAGGSSFASGFVLGPGPSVPDGGVTFSLLALALLGLAGVRRMFRLPGRWIFPRCH